MNSGTSKFEGVWGREASLPRASWLEDDVGWVSFPGHGAGGGTWTQAASVTKLRHACWSLRLLEYHFLDVSRDTAVLLNKVKDFNIQCEPCSTGTSDSEADDKTCK